MGADQVTFILQLAIIGICSGALYGVIAIGYSMVYGVLGTINFSHGDICALGGYIGYVAICTVGVPFQLAVLIAALLTGAILLLLERMLFRRLSAASGFALLVGHIGVSLAIRSLLALSFGEGARSFDDGRPEEGVRILGALVAPEQLTLLAVVAGLLMLLGLLLTKSQLGRSLRAVAQDREAAAAMGIPVAATIVAAYVIGGALGGAAGVLSAQLTYLTPQVGIFLGIKAFTACVIGGIGRIQGAAVGGVLVGLFESFSTGILGSRFSEALIFVLLVATLIAFPGGVLMRASRRAGARQWS